NLAVYPPALFAWVWVIASLRAPMRALTRGASIDAAVLVRARRRVINLPWWIVVICGAGWLLCIPVFLWALARGGEPLHPLVYVHLPAWLVGRLVTEPIYDLTRAAESVGAGNLGVTIDRPRADEFGPLIDAFNGMVAGLREKARIEENFGRHVGETVARAIMARPEGLG